jgi:hypothetical protein
MTMTPSRQRNAVSEGMALGILMCGRNEIPWDKLGIDLSFETAWRSWPHRDRFSQVSTDLRNGSDGVWIVTRADAKKRVWHLFWDTSGSTIAIHARAQWDDEDVDPHVVASSISDDISAEAWRALASDFLSKMRL